MVSLFSGGWLTTSNCSSYVSHRERLNASVSKQANKNMYYGASKHVPQRLESSLKSGISKPLSQE